MDYRRMSPSCKIFLFLTLIGLVGSNGFSSGFQSLPLTQIDEKFGLPGKSVRAIAQCKKGVVWMGTETAGLVSYNGSEFVAYRNDPNDPYSISGNFIEAVFIDSKDRLWVGAINGLNLFDRRTQQFIRYEEAVEIFEGGEVYTVAEDQSGFIWFGGTEHAARLDPDTGGMSFYEIYDDINEEKMALAFRTITRMNDGRLFFGTQRGLFQYDQASNRILPSGYNRLFDDDDDALLIYSIADDGKGGIWLSTQSGLLHYNPLGNHIEQFPLADGTDQHSISSREVLVDQSGAVWAGTFYSGIRIIDPETGQTYSHTQNLLAPNGLKSNQILCFYEDRNGLVWIGVKGQGVFIYDSRSRTFPHYPGPVLPSAQSMRNSIHVKTLLEDHRGVIWIGTMLDGILGFDPVSNTYDRLREIGSGETGIHTRNTKAAIEDRSNTLWFGTPEGLLSFDSDRKNSARYPCSSVKELLESSDGTLYVGTRSGLLVFDRSNEQFTPFPEVQGADKTKLSSTETSVLIEDSKGNIWIGTRQNGLYSYNPRTAFLRHYGHKEEDLSSLQSNLIRSLLEDQNGDLWVGTKAGGLSRYLEASDSFENIGVKQGLPHDSVYSILKDEAGGLWLSMHEGLVCFKPATNDVSIYSREYGLQSDKFDELNTAIRLKNGTFIVGGERGFNIFDPAVIKKDGVVSDIVVSSFKVLNDERVGEIVEGKPIEINYDRNYITIAFALTNYESPKRNEFAYKLEGFDEEWVYSGTRNYAIYTELPAKGYTFRVKGKSPSGEWSEEPYALDIVVHPAFWMTKGFLVFVILLVLAVAVLIYGLLIYRSHWQRRRLEKLVADRTDELRHSNQLLEESKHSLEDKVQERTKDLIEANNRAEKAMLKAQKADHLKSAFLANMSHEIRTPMNAILGFSSMLDDTSLTESDRASFVNSINRSGHELLHLVDDIIDLSTIQADQVRLVKTEVDLMVVFREIHQSSRLELMRQEKEGDIELKWLTQENLPVRLVTDGMRLKQIITNLINNAIKFTERGSVEFGYELESDQEWIRFYVRDTGIGIAEELQEVIFARFRKIETFGNKLYRGSGLGLSISRHLARLLGGDVTVESVLGEGSTFSLRLPLIAKEVISVSESNETEGPLKTPVSILSTEVSHTKTDKRDLIIVAEDEDSNYDVIVSMLRQENIDIVRAFDGVEAIEIHQKFPNAKMILMDIKMPRMDGLEAAKKIRAMDEEIIIIANTGHVLPSEKDNIMTGEFNDFLSKPLTREQLTACIGRYF